MYWGWISNSNPGTLIGKASTDSKGDFSGRTYTVPGSTSNGLYTLAAVGATSNAVALTQFTVGTPQLNTHTNAYDWPNFGYDLQGPGLTRPRRRLTPETFRPWLLNGRVLSQPSIASRVHQPL